MPTLDRQDDVFVLDLGDAENRLHPDWLAEVHAHLDEVERAPAPKALVTAATGKIWSNGLDLDWLSGHADQTTEYLATVQSLLSRVLTLPMITVAALQGHTFAAGAMFSLVHDFRVMRADRGYWCLPEADLNMPFTTGMTALIQARLTPYAAHAAMVGARRFGGLDALAVRIVDAAVADDLVRSTAVELAAANLAKAGPVLGTIKSGMYRRVVDLLAEQPFGGTASR